jgi:hypothetical protein
MTGNEQDAQRIRHGRRAVAVAAAVAAAVLGSVSSALASPSAMPAASSAAAGISRTGQATSPLADGSRIPAGWAPVPYRRAQLSVPGLWLVESPQQFWCGPPQSHGMIFVGSRPVVPKGAGCGLTASVAWIRPAGHIPPGISRRTPAAVIHGIPVYRLPGGTDSVLYLAPDLGVRVGARGPLAKRVLATLTRSPLSVVLRRGPAGAVPASWIWRQFGGVRFATPRWHLQRENQWATCGTGLVPRSLLLIDATRPPAYLPCPAPIPFAVAEQAQPGLTVVTGKYAAKSVGEDFARCQARRGARICLSTITGQGGFASGVLIFSVSRPHEHVSAFFLLGLSGSGTLPRTIFGSISVPRH